MGSIFKKLKQELNGRYEIKHELNRQKFFIPPILSLADIVEKVLNLKQDRPGYKFWFGHLQLVRSGTSHFTSLRLSVLICKMGVIVHLRGCSKNTVKCTCKTGWHHACHTTATR